jgi:hypothetical protein
MIKNEKEIEIEELKTKLAQVNEINDKYREALEFYEDIENWDDDRFSPTIWDDGNIDMGRRARNALGKGEG